jgi:uncharacterized membrane protein YidH (DUF202 family)
MKDTAKIQLGLGNILCWIATAIAILMVTLVFADLLVGLAQGDPIVRVVALTAAIAIWLLGRACRFL